MRLQLLASLILCGSMFATALAQNPFDGATLFDGPAVFEYTSGGNAGTLPGGLPTGIGQAGMNFQLNGGGNPLDTDQLFSGNWYYRINNDTRERYFTAGAAQARNYTGNYVHYMFDQVYLGTSPLPGVSADMDFGLTSYGPNAATVNTEVCFHNFGNIPLNINLFFALDADLAGSLTQDVYDPLNSAPGRLITFSDVITIPGELTYAAMYGPTATGSGMDDASNIIYTLPNGVGDTSTSSYMPDVNASGGLFPDGSAVVQWQFVVNSGSTACVPFYFGVGVGRPAIVPEPSSFALLALGPLALVRRKRAV